MPDSPLTFDFPAQSAAQWLARVARELPAGQTADRLTWQPAGETYAVAPFHTAADLAALPHLHTVPGAFPYIRGHKEAANTWRYLDLVPVGPEALADAQQALAGGADGVLFDLADPAAFDLAALSRTFDLTQTVVGYRLPAAADTPAFLTRLTAALHGRGQSANGLRGFVEVAAPDLALAPASVLDALLEAARPAPDFYGLTADGAALADAGAAPTFQLAATLSQLVQILADLTDRGLEPETIVGELRCTLGLGTDYFQAIALLRALRLLWATVLTAFEVAPHHTARLRVNARPSWRIVFAPDPDTNLLRLTTSAMAAVIGGTDELLILPFDAATDTGATRFGRRQARNISLLLRHEAHLAEAVDPAAGSYYLETLTDTLAREAWAQFQQLEAAGGYRAAHATGQVAAQVAKGAATPAVVGQVRVGVNKYQ